MSEGRRRNQNHRQMRRPAPPMRLSWPSISSSQLKSANQSSGVINNSVIPSDDSSRAILANTNNKKINARTEMSFPGMGKRRKRKTNSSSASGDHPSSCTKHNSRDNDLWVDIYAPQKVADLCVAPKKIQEVQSWLVQALGQQTQQQHQQQRSHSIHIPRSKLLILVGSPGIGKSTAVRVLAKELNLDLLEWNDSYYDPSFRYRQGASRGNSYNDGGVFMTVDDYDSPINLFDKFLKQTGVGFQSLDILSTTNKKAESKTSVGTELASKPKKNKKTESSNETRGLGTKGSVILLDDLPVLNTPEAQIRFREIMNEHLLISQVPTILVFSDTREGKHRPADLELLIDTTYLYSEVVQIMQIQPVTKTRLKKVLDNVAKKERLQISPQHCEQLHVQCGGDIRHAIMMLQFDTASSGQATTRDGIFQRKQVTENNQNGNIQRNQRDVKLSTFHALGKALYAKRKASDDNNKIGGSERPPLDYDPDNVLNDCGMELSGAITFLESHSVDFFTDITELSDALDCFSDAALFADQPIDQRRDLSSFPDGYVASLAGRAVASANKHPAPNRFRQLSSPKIFDVIRKRRENEVEARNLQRRLLMGPGNFPLGDALRAKEAFITDCLPYIRLISPLSVNSSLDRMHSFFCPNNGDSRNLQDKELAAESAAKIMREQDQILQLDDILDCDSDDNDNCTSSFSVKPRILI